MKAQSEATPTRPSRIFATLTDIQNRFPGRLRKAPSGSGSTHSRGPAGRPFRRPREPRMGGPEESGPGPAARPRHGREGPERAGPRPGRSQPPLHGPAAAIAGRERGRCARGLLASRSPPVGRSLSCRPPARPETPPRRQRPTRSVAHSEGNPGGAQREAARLGSARRGRIPRAQRRRREELRRPRQSAPWAGRGGTGLGPPGRYAERRPRAVPGTAPPECSAPPRLWKGRGCRGSRSLPCGAFLP